MIKSIKFTGETGYISEKHEKPDKPRSSFRDSHYEEAYKRYKEKLKFYNKNKGKYIREKLAANLLNRTITFEKDKINVIFGPNASGKTTIMKALAGYALIEDGFTAFTSPVDLRTKWDADLSVDDVIRKRNEMMKNSAEIEWDGSPIYYENIASRRSYAIGDLCGSLITDTLEEVSYIFSKQRSSMGQHSLFILNKVIEIASKKITLQDITSKYTKSNVNDVWANCYKVQEDYFKTFPNFDKPGTMTVMFDEMDKSLDITNVIALYRDFLPKILKELEIQIIIISHSPVIMSDVIYNSENYNIISLDEEYTEKVRKEIKTLF